ncbi:13710_t:CDS:2 [Acaulospora morrowiae]|uniref:13710_t:CDS:1 n=1 Tax=Acaulospora morrowiae TaxID=94023 RepID=A0A9N8VSK7_9GLOM|nr:13710_t:CDS:2 [Acaulospora morrowiae]
MTINLLEILSKDYRTLLETGDFADIIIKVNDETLLQAHSLVLKARSSYFRAKLATGCSNEDIEHGKQKLRVVSFNKPNISPKLFSVLLMYIYFGTIELSQYNVSEVIYLLCGARELCLNELCDYIQDYFINQKELVKRHFFFVARASYNHFEKLSTFCNNILREDPETFINSQDFMMFKKKELLSFYKNHPSNIREIVLWEKLVEWGVSQFPPLTLDITTWTNDDYNSLRELMDSFIQCIDFQKVSRSEFLQKVRPFKKLFEDSFYIEILEHHTFPELSDSPTLELTTPPSSSSTNTPTESSSTSPVQHQSQPALRSQPQFISEPPLQPQFTSQPQPQPRPQISTGNGLLNKVYAKLIVQWINETMMLSKATNYNFRLLIRGSNHGFSSKAFHDRCDMKGSTLTLINISKTDEIIGGFNPLNWVLDRSKGVYQKTKNSFIFSLNKTDMDKSIYSRVVDEAHAVYSHIDFGPCFGAKKYDLKLYGKFDDGNGNCCNKKSYAKGIRSSGESFKVKEYEVYQVVKVP